MCACAWPIENIKCNYYLFYLSLNHLEGTNTIKNRKKLTCKDPKGCAPSGPVEQCNTNNMH